MLMRERSSRGKEEIIVAGETPEAWVDKQVVVNLIPQLGTSLDEPAASRIEGQLRGISDWGVTVLSTYDSEAPGDYQRTEFYPWSVVWSVWPVGEFRGDLPPM
jgi:hypothetical protein